MTQLLRVHTFVDKATTILILFELIISNFILNVLFHYNVLKIHLEIHDDLVLVDNQNQKKLLSLITEVSVVAQTANKTILNRIIHDFPSILVCLKRLV